MELTILKDNLKDALSVVERMVAKSPTLPILNNILLSAKGSSLEISATDLEVGVRYTMPSEIKQEGRIVVPAKHLSQFVGFLPESQITLVQKQNGLNIKAKGHSTKLNILSPDDFPIIPEVKGDEPSVQVETAPFCRGLAQVMGMAGQSQARPEISGILFVFQNNTLKLASTDSFRLAAKTMVFSDAQTKGHTFILPQKTARELVGVLGDRPGKTTIYFGPNQAIFDYAAQEE